MEQVILQVEYRMYSLGLSFWFWRWGSGSGRPVNSRYCSCKLHKYWQLSILFCLEAKVSKNFLFFFNFATNLLLEDSEFSNVIIILIFRNNLATMHLLFLLVLFFVNQTKTGVKQSW